MFAYFLFLVLFSMGFVVVVLKNNLIRKGSCAIKKLSVLVPECNLSIDNFTDTSNQSVFSGNNSQAPPPLLSL